MAGLVQLLYISTFMKKSVFNSRAALAVGIAIGCVAGLVVVTGCGFQEKDVVGKYTRAGGIVSELLILRSDHIYEQELIYANGNRFLQTNTWKKINGVIEFEAKYWANDELTFREIEPPKMFTLSRLEIDRGMLGNFDQNYIYRKTQ